MERKGKTTQMAQHLKQFPLSTLLNGTLTRRPRIMLPTFQSLDRIVLAHMTGAAVIQWVEQLATDWKVSLWFLAPVAYELKYP